VVHPGQNFYSPHGSVHFYKSDSPLMEKLGLCDFKICQVFYLLFEIARKVSFFRVRLKLEK
jgi:hypothetical protein